MQGGAVAQMPRASRGAVAGHPCTLRQLLRGPRSRPTSPPPPSSSPAVLRLGQRQVVSVDVPGACGGGRKARPHHEEQRRAASGQSRRHVFGAGACRGLGGTRSGVKGCHTCCASSSAAAAAILPHPQDPAAGGMPWARQPTALSAPFSKNTASSEEQPGPPVIHSTTGVSSDSGSTRAWK